MTRASSNGMRHFGKPSTRRKVLSRADTRWLSSREFPSVPSEESVPPVPSVDSVPPVEGGHARGAVTLSPPSDGAAFLLIRLIKPDGSDGTESTDGTDGKFCASRSSGRKVESSKGIWKLRWSACIMNLSGVGDGVGFCVPEVCRASGTLVCCGHFCKPPVNCRRFPVPDSVPVRFPRGRNRIRG